MSKPLSRPLNNMRWLITGARGFVGTHLVDYLMEIPAVESIWGIDRSPKPVAKRYATALRMHSAGLQDVNALCRCISEIQPTHIVHLAAQSSVAASWKAPIDCFLNNTNIFLNLVEAVRLTQCPSTILSVGSSEEYGPRTAEEIPLKESLFPSPTNPYAVARVSQELLSRVYADSYGLSIICTRSFNHVGPNQPDHYVASSFCKQAVEVLLGRREMITAGNLDIVRDFIDVRDVVRAYVLLLTHGQSGSLYNVCSGQGTQLSQLVEMICKLAAVAGRWEIDPSRVRPTDNPSIVGDSSRLVALGFKPRYSLVQSLSDQIATWKQTLATS